MKHVKLVMLFCIMQLPVLAGVCTAKTYPLGMYVMDLYNFNQVDETFCTDFWIWSVYPGEEVDFNGTIDSMNAMNFEPHIYSSEPLGTTGEIWMQQKIRGEFRCNWNLANYPFDRTALKIEIEDFREIDKVHFKADTVNSKVSNMIELDDWNISPLTLSEQIVTYDTNFGNIQSPDTANSFSRIIGETTVSRKTPWVIFFKLTIGVYIAFFLSLISLHMKPDTDSRLALPCAALFAVVSNKYVVESTVPSSATLTLLDSIHFLTMVCILCICVVLVVTDGMRVSGKRFDVYMSCSIDRLSKYIITGSYIVLNVWMLLYYISIV